MAQTADEAAATVDTEVADPNQQATRDVVVTLGTQIKGLDLDGAVQAIQIDRDEIVQSGALSVIDLLQDLTVTGGGSGTFSSQSGGPLSGDTPPGAAGVSLRGLGTSATLTLINGRRASVSSFANGQESFIDVNSIPLSAIERVEVLPSGASALYGADAIAGVVNYVLRDDYEGAELDISYGNSTAGTDDSKFNVNGLFGFEESGHHVMFIFDYYNRAALFDRDRAVSRNSVRPSQQGFFPSFNDLFFTFFDQTEEPQDGGCPAEDFGFGGLGEFCEVNTNAFTSSRDAFESYGGVFTHRYDFSDNLTWRNEFMYQRTDSSGTASPANFSRAPVDPENPNWPAALIEDMEIEGSFEGLNDFSDFFGFPIFAWGKFLDPRAVDVSSNTWRAVTELEYEFDSGWVITGGFTYGENKRTQRGTSGLVVSERFYDAMLGNLCTDGTTVDRWDVDPERPDAFFNGGSCEDVGKETWWYNPFGGQVDQPAGLNEFLRTEAERTGKSKLLIADVSASGDLFEFNGNMVKAAFGIEYRYEDLRDVPAGIAQATLDNPEPILGFSSTSADIDRSNYSAFAEFYVPLTDTLDFQAAGRFEHSSGYGSDFSPKFSLRWQPVEQLIFRGHWGRSFRAPSLAQAGAGTLLSFFRVDCMETPGACDGDALADGEDLFSEDVGNPDLESETSNNWGLGAIWRPNNDIEITVDYWNIKHKNLVGIDEEDFIRRALMGEFTVVDTADGFLPTGEAGLEVTNGFVTDAHFALTNLGFQRTSGFDVSYTHYFDLGNAGTLAFLGDVSYLIEFDRQASDASAVEEEAGEFRFPRWRARTSLRWTYDAWRVAFTWHYTSSYWDDPDNRTLEAVGLAPGTRVRVSSWNVFDLSISYDLDDKSFVSVRADNLFDNDPPLVLGSGANYDTINHDNMGRFLSIRYNRRF